MIRFCDLCGQPIPTPQHQNKYEDAVVCDDCLEPLHIKIITAEITKKDKGKPKTPRRIARDHYERFYSGGDVYIWQVPKTLKIRIGQKALEEGCRVRDVWLAAAWEMLKNSTQ